LLGIFTGFTGLPESFPVTTSLKKITYLHFQDSRELFIKKKIFKRVGFSFVIWKPSFGS
jgi:hypothetical protein